MAARRLRCFEITPWQDVAGYLLVKWQDAGGYLGIKLGLGFRVVYLITENHLEKKLDNKIETIVRGFSEMFSEGSYFGE